MSVDYHGLLWQQLSKKFATGPNQAFVMAEGKYLIYSDYYLAYGNERVAAYNTFMLTNGCVACNANYNLTGSNMSTLWDTLFNAGRGPPPTGEQQARFENAKRRLYTDYDGDVKSPLYKKYIAAQDALRAKKAELKTEIMKQSTTNWEARLDAALRETKEYADMQRMEEEVAPLIKDLRTGQYGPLYETIKPFKDAFDDNKRTITLKGDTREKTYYYVSMIPSNWYDWLNPQQFQDDTWATITVDAKSFDATQDREYKKLGGSLSVGVSFLSIKAGGEGSQEKKIDTGSSRGVKISFKVRSVQINRPWLDTGALKIEHYVVPGVGPGAWSTGVLDSSNKGSFPLLTTQMIVVGDVTVTAEKWSKEVTDALTKFDAKAGVGVIYGVFKFGAGASGGSSDESHTFHFDSAGSSLTLKGTQVIGYVGTLVPKYGVQT